MSVSPQMMQMMLARQQAAGASPAVPPGAQPAAAAPQGSAAPMGAPMATPNPQQGKQEHASVLVHIAMQMLEQALPGFGSQSEEGHAVIRTLDTLARKFGKRDTGDLVPAEIMSMVRNMPQMGGGSPVQKMLIQQMQRGNMPAPGGQPPQAPPQGG